MTIAPESTENPASSGSLMQLVWVKWAAVAGAAVSLAALTCAVLIGQKLSNVQEQLARQSAQAGAQSIEAKTIAREAIELARDTAAKVMLSESRLNEVALQRSQLEALMASLSRTRDENLVVDIEAAYKRAIDAGAKELLPPRKVRATGIEGKQAFVAGPDGERIEFMEIVSGEF